MKIGIFTNIHKDKDLAFTKRLSEQLQKSGAKVLVYGDASKLLHIKDGFLSEEAPEVMLTLGGDGTILRIVTYCAERKVPILGVNLGTVGFLTGLEAAGAEELAEILKSRDYKTEKRALLNIKHKDACTLALNEAVLSRKNSGKLISLEVKVNGDFVDTYNCDGFIVATPTGSTAYSLSAGGPIVTPLSDVFALTPINPHTLHARPIVIAGGDTVRITFAGEAETCELIADGREAGTIYRGDAVEISKSLQYAEFIKTGGGSFFSRLLNKLNIWSVTEKR